MFNKESGRKKMPQAHKELIQKVHLLLQERGYSFWDAQMVTGLVLAATKAKEPVKALDTAAEITRMFEDARVDKIYTSAMLQILAEKINEQINQTAMSNIQLSEI